jgi:tol-pal system protein YbgF
MKIDRCASLPGLAMLTVSLVLALVPVASAQDDVQALSDKLNRMQQELSDLERQVYNGQPPTSSAGAAPTGDLAASQEVRLQQLETQMSSLTGQLEKLRNALERGQPGSPALQQGGANSPGGGTVGAATAASGAAAAQSAPAQGSASAEPLNPNQPLKQSSLAPQTLGTLTQRQLEAAKVQPPPGAATAAAEQAGSVNPATATGGQLPADTVEGQYEYAFNLLRQAKYEDAEKALSAFLAQHPNDYLSGNAQYWLGETYYVRGRYQDAAVAFAEGYQKYPNNGKAPDDLLKLGMSLGQLGKKADACVAFAELTTKFPSAPDSVTTRLKEEKRRYACR